MRRSLWRREHDTPVRHVEEEGPKRQRERERQQSRKDKEVEMVLSNEKQ